MYIFCDVLIFDSSLLASFLCSRKIRKMNKDHIESEFYDIHSETGRDIKDELNRIINRAKSENEALQKVLEKMKEGKQPYKV